MPAKNTLKSFAPEQMWHVYNRGVDGRNIFLVDRDYLVFLSFMKVCLTEERPSEETLKLIPFDVIRLRRLNLYKEVELVSYCLMPNHFHLQLYQYTADGISKLMRSVMTGYVMYFNRKQQRSGRLFQGTYKASLINSEPYWQHISRYIHLNPLDIHQDYKIYKYSSYKYFTRLSSPGWLQPGHVTGSFSSKREYENFLADYKDHKRKLEEIKQLLANS